MGRMRHHQVALNVRSRGCPISGFFDRLGSTTAIGPVGMNGRDGWIADVPDLPNQRCICPVPTNDTEPKKQAIPLERLLPAHLLAGLRNAVTLFDTNDRHYHEPCPREGEEKAFGFTTDVMRRQALRVRPGQLILVGRV
jgi:hypothetical protein